MLEVTIESTRLLNFLYTLGLTNVKKGGLRIVQLFTKAANRTQNWRTAIIFLKTSWKQVLLNITVYLIVTFIINKLIEYAACQTCLLYKLKLENIISETSSEWVLLLFFKNLSVIPLTLIFNVIFLLWITNKLKVNTENNRADLDSG